MSTAIRNVGELASPYFLVEVWARRDEIDIDPETFATLKQKTRRLVREMRAFETRDEEPDDEWREARRDLLGPSSIERLPISIGQTGVALSVSRNGDSVDTVLLGDLPGAPDPDRRLEGQDDPPATAFELALDEYDGDADWGLLLAGLELRLYRRSSGISQQYLAVDLADLVELDDHDTWRAFAGIFRVNAFEPDESGVPLVRRVVDESRRHASELADDMRDDVVAAAEAIIQAALDDPANADVVGDPSRALSHQLFEETLYYLYRALFVLFAEAHDVLPVSGGGPYATTYSVDHLVERARSEPESADGTYFQQALSRLFALLWDGGDGVAVALGIEPVGGELFDPSRTSLLDRCRIGDAAWRRALVALVLGADGSPRRRLGRRSSFAEIGVDRLGSIYEGLLTLEPYRAPGPRVLVRVDGDRRVLEADVAGDSRVLRSLREGDFVLESASGRRKGSGSFYTPAEITEYLASAALDPLTTPILERAKTDPAWAATELLALRVCDPAMGSGAFLVQAARTLGLALARARAAAGDGRVTPELVRRSKRDVVRHCLYGVDLNPLAVVLAKVSLWLETLEKGKPLSFLDAHLRLGDSLVGVQFRGELGALTTDELAQWPKTAHKGLETYLKKEAGDRGEPVLEALKQRKAPTRAKQPTLEGVGASAVVHALAEIAASREALIGSDDEESFQLELAHAREFADLEARVDSLRNRLRTAADFWCAQWFSSGEDTMSDNGTPVVPASGGEFQEILELVLNGKSIPERLRDQVAAAHAVAKARHFFHWALEFPEVIVESGGFDAVIGNPPWNTLSPDVKEFFSTHDPQIFKKGVPKADQSTRKSALREDPEIDADWRRQARFLHELSHYVKPASGRFSWYAEDGQLRKGDANVFRLFVEQAYRLLRPGGRLAQVLPDSVYVSSPATGVRKQLLENGVLERCYVFENRRKIFPIDSRIKVVLLTAQAGGGPTAAFRAAFLVGRDAAGRDRARSVEDLPSVLRELDETAALLEVTDISLLAPETWSFPELRTALDAQIAAHMAAVHPPLNLDSRGWGLTYCRELSSGSDAHLFVEAAEIAANGGASDDGIWWVGSDEEWWPLVEGALFYNLAFPAGGKLPRYWVRRSDLLKLESRKNADGTLTMDHYRLAWRDVSRSVDERSAIAAVIPPRTVAKDTAPTVWGGLLDCRRTVALAGLLSSFCVDYVVRFRGRGHLKSADLNSVFAPSFHEIEPLVQPAAEVISGSESFTTLWSELYGPVDIPCLDPWGIATRRAAIDAIVAKAYRLSAPQYAALLSTFPNLDTVQPMLPGEPKSFVTRDLALMTYAEFHDDEAPDIVDLLELASVDLPAPRPDLRRLDARVERYRELGAVPYRPTPRGGRPPTDPELIETVRSLLTDDGQTAGDIAEALEEDTRAVKAILDKLVTEGDAFASGRGKGRRFYVIEDDE